MDLAPSIKACASSSGGETGRTTQTLFVEGRTLAQVDRIGGLTA